jgi:Ti-type conjugative transfer relaxase TraA
LAAAGHDFVLDLRSYADQRVKLTPTTHIGPNGNERRDKKLDSTSVDAHAAARELSAEDIERDPGCIIRLVTRQQSVFDRRDIARALHTFIDHPVLFARALDRALAHPELHRLAEPETDTNGKDINPAKFTTTTMFGLESRMFARALDLAKQQRRAVSHSVVTAALKRCPLELSEEQAAAIEHITRGADLASIVGYAGTGKSTLLQVAANAWTDAGHEVVGGSLASKAARGLQASSDIPSKTIAKWIWNWNQGEMRLSANSVFVLDEAGMVGSADMGSIVAEVTRAGAKLVLVGDPEQLQPIAAGGAFRALVTQSLAFELAGVRRQIDPWARAATVAFQRGDIAAAVKAYDAHGAFAFVPDRIAAVTAVADAVMASRDQLNRSGKPATQIVLAHRNDDILALNTVIHERRAEAGLLGPDVTVATTNGDRLMAVGDRLLFLKNADLGTATSHRSGETTQVSNSDLGTILSIKDGVPVKDGGIGPVLTVAIDGGKTVTFDAKSYPDFDLGYATTIHKSQGETVDRVIVLASSSMDKSLAYVAMSRHRDSVKVIVPKSELADLKALTWSFSRTSPKLTTLDYAEQRGVGPKPVMPLELSPLVQAGRAVVDAARHTFEAVKAKFEAVVAAVQARLAPVAVVAKPVTAVPTVEVKPVVEAKPTGTAPGPVVERAEPPVVVKPLEAKPEPSVLDGAKITPDRTGTAPRPPKETSISRLVERVAVVKSIMVDIEARGLTVRPDLHARMHDARAALEAEKPGTVKLLDAALKRDPDMRATMAAPAGRERGLALVAAMDREEKAILDPLVRAGRMVTDLAVAAKTLAGLTSWDGDAAKAAAKATMHMVIAEIVKDPAAQSAMRDHAVELKIDPNSKLAAALREPDLAKALTKTFDPPTRSQGLVM